MNPSSACIEFEKAWYSSLTPGWSWSREQHAWSQLGCIACSKSLSSSCGLSLSSYVNQVLSLCLYISLALPLLGHFVMQILWLLSEDLGHMHCSTYQAVQVWRVEGEWQHQSARWPQHLQFKSGRSSRVLFEGLGTLHLLCKFCYISSCPEREQRHKIAKRVTASYWRSKNRFVVFRGLVAFVSWRHQLSVPQHCHHSCRHNACWSVTPSVLAVPCCLGCSWWISLRIQVLWWFRSLRGWFAWTVNLLRVTC